jgi:hypothetical protein
MKIAVAYFGLPRCSSVSMPSIEHNLFSHFPTCSEYRCFYHFYQQSQVVNPRSGENGMLDDSNYQPFMQYEGLLEEPHEALKNLPLNSLKPFGDAWGDDFNSLRNLLLQLNSLKKVTGLIKAYAPDVVLFARPDLVYHDPVPPHVYLMANEYRDSVFVPNWQWGSGLNDTFAVCGRGAFEVYGNRLDEAFNYCQETNKPLHAEHLLKYVLLKGKKDIYHLNVKASRVRIGGVIAKENFVPFKNYFFARFTNPFKRFYFITGIKTRIKTYFFLKKLSGNR